jgi:uncharacterized membrane protein
MHPFDWHSVLFARHAQHVVMIHFPIALYLAAVLFDLLSGGRKENPLYSAAYCNFTLAALMTIPVLGSGFLAWQFALFGQKLKGILLLHLVLALSSAVLIWLVWWIHRRARGSQQALPAVRLLPELAGAALITVTAHLGGFLSGVNA